MTETASESVQAMSEAGVADPALYDHSTPLVAPEEPAPPVQQEGEVIPPAPPGMKHVIINVPTKIPDGMVKAAFETGMMVIQTVQQGRMMITFPHVQQDPKTGKPKPVLGNYGVLARNDLDIKLILDLAQTINKANMKIAEKEQHGRPGERIAEHLAQKNIKDTAAGQAMKAASTGEVSKIILET